jgi:hypothetical protein
MSTLLVSGALCEGIDQTFLAVSGYEEGTTTAHYFMTFLFIVFVIMANLTILNMLIGVLCEVISRVGAYEKEKSTVEFAKMELEMLFGEADLNETGGLEVNEFMTLLQNDEVKSILEGLEIDPHVLNDMASVIFHGDSKYVRKTKGVLDFPGFLEVILEFRASQLARVTDLVEIRRAMVDENESLQQRIKHLKAMLSELNRMADKLLKAEGIDFAKLTAHA